MIHTTVGVYPNGQYKTNGVKSEDLAQHIWYNTTFRPGHTLFVDEVLIYKGIGFSDKLKEEWCGGIEGRFDIEPTGKITTIKKKIQCTAPYV